MSNSVTDNPRKCPACGGRGDRYNVGTGEYRCPQRKCGVNWFYRGEITLTVTTDPQNYVRGSDGRVGDGVDDQD